MNDILRAKIYALLSKLYSDTIDARVLNDLKTNKEILTLFGEDANSFILNSYERKVLNECNIDFSSIFLLNAKPIESSVIDSKSDVLVGLSNPVMEFYFKHGYNINLINTHIQTPDHISIELGFMQKLILDKDTKAQRVFLKKHLLSWAISYLISISDMAKTPFYKDLFDFTIEFLVSDYSFLKAEA